MDFQELDTSTQGHRVEGNIAFNVDGNFIESDAEGKLLSSKNSYSGSAAYFNGITEFSVLNTEVSAVTADFFDYENADYRVKRTSNVFNRFKGSGNMGAFQKVFGHSKMLIVDNSRDEKELVTQTLSTASRFIRSRMRTKPENGIAMSWIKRELEAKKRI